MSKRAPIEVKIGGRYVPVLAEEKRGGKKRYRLARKGDFDPKSFRTVKMGGGKSLIIGCPKGKWAYGRCTVGTRGQSFIEPIRNPYWVRSAGIVWGGPFETMGEAAAEARYVHRTPSVRGRLKMPVQIVEADSKALAKSDGIALFTVGKGGPQINPQWLQGTVPRHIPTGHELTRFYDSARELKGEMFQLPGESPRLLLHRNPTRKRKRR